jgi:hypothetical protein
MELKSILKELPEKTDNTDLFAQAPQAPAKAEKVIDGKPQKFAPDLFDGD